MDEATLQARLLQAEDCVKFLNENLDAWRYLRKLSDPLLRGFPAFPIALVSDTDLLQQYQDYKAGHYFNLTKRSEYWLPISADVGLEEAYIDLTSPELPILVADWKYGCEYVVKTACPSLLKFIEKDYSRLQKEEKEKDTSDIDTLNQTVSVANRMGDERKIRLAEIHRIQQCINRRIEQCMKCRYGDDFIKCEHYETTSTECEYYEFPINNSKWSFIRLFSFKGRIGRTEMWLTTFLEYCLVLIIILDGIIEDVDSVLGKFLLVVPIVLSSWIWYAQLIKRFHDLDRPWTDVLFLCIPIYNLWISFKIFFFKGIDEVNKYGTSPRKSFEEQVYKSDNECFSFRKKEESNSVDKVTEDDLAKCEGLEGDHYSLLVNICAKYLSSLHGVSVENQPHLNCLLRELPDLELDENYVLDNYNPRSESPFFRTLGLNLRLYVRLKSVEKPRDIDFKCDRILKSYCRELRNKYKNEPEVLEAKLKKLHSQMEPLPKLPECEDPFKHITLPFTQEAIWQAYLLKQVGHKIGMYWHGFYNQRIFINREKDIDSINLNFSHGDKVKLEQFKIEAKASWTEAMRPMVILDGDKAYISHYWFDYWNGLRQVECWVSYDSHSQKITDFLIKESDAIVCYDCGIKL